MIKLSKNDVIETEGKVIDIIPGGKFKVELDGGHIVEAHVSGKMRVNNIRILPGDTVVIELSPYDLTHGRIVYNKKQEVIDMKVRASVKPICEKCKVIKRKSKVMVICENPKHKQKQG